MVKPREDVVREFNELVNMSAHELSTWLENPESTRAGTGVGLQSGRRIIDILTRNPSQDPDKFADEDIPHMGKVVGCVFTCTWGSEGVNSALHRYIKRHRAREDHLKRTKTPEELEHTKSTIRCACAYLHTTYRRDLSDQCGLQSTQLGLRTLAPA